MNRKSDTAGRLNGLVRERIVPIIGAVIVFITAFSVLYLGDNIGLSDNGDFRRVLLTNNIEYKDNTDHRYVFNQHYTMKLDNGDNLPKAMIEAWKTNKNQDIYSSPHFLIIKISKELNIIANAVTGKPLSNYNIAYMALLYIFMLSAAALVIFTFFADAKIRIQIAVFVMFIFVFCDAGYLMYFNSFYGEPLQYTALMMLISFGMLIYKRPSVPKAIGFFISLYFFAGAKLANIPYSLIAATLAVLIVIMRRDLKFKAGVILAALISLVSIAGLYSLIPDWMSNDTTYQSVFFGVTKNSPDPAQDLRELGVNEKYASLAGTHAYMDPSEYPVDISSDEFKHDFYDKVSKTDIAFFYLRHPVRFVKVLSYAVKNSAYIRPPGIGNSADTPMETTDKFSGWSHLRVFLRFLYTPWTVFAAFIIITVYMIFMNVFYIHNHKIESPQKKYTICAIDILILGLWINLVLPELCNGDADIAKHMFLFTNCIDILFCVCILGILLMPPKNMLKAAALLTAFTLLFRIQIPKKTMTFGMYNGRPIEWEIIKDLNGRKMLVTKECIAYRPFDGDSSDWETSDLRFWLNNEFIGEFSSAEREKIVSVQNDVILTYENRDFAESGNHAHYFNFTPAHANDMADTAYRKGVTDNVFIPTPDMVKNLNAPDSYWILCPYTGNTNMEQFMNRDGFILYTDTSRLKGVRAAIVIND